MIFKGDETPYAMSMAKEKEASEECAATLLTTDASINKSIEDYIVQATISQETLRIVKRISEMYYLSHEHKARVIKDILTEEEE